MDSEVQVLFILSPKDYNVSVRDVCKKNKTKQATSSLSPNHTGVQGSKSKNVTAQSVLGRRAVLVRG